MIIRAAVIDFVVWGLGVHTVQALFLSNRYSCQTFGLLRSIHSNGYLAMNYGFDNDIKAVNNLQYSSNNNNRANKKFQVFKLFQRAQFLIKNGDNLSAKLALLKCLELDPQDSHSWLALSRLEAKLGNTVKSREYFSESIIRCPKNVHLLHAWGHMEQKAGNIALAKDCWAKALEIDPFNAYICHALSSLEISLRNYEEAKKILTKVVEYKPTATLCTSLAELERQLGNPEQSKAVLIGGLEVCSKDLSQMILALAWLEEDVFNNYPEAERLIMEALSKDPANVRVHIAQASIWIRMKKIDAARDLLKKATLLKSRDGQHFTMLSTIEYELGNIEEAREILQQGAKLFPGDHFLLQRWGFIESKLSNNEKAKVLYERSTKIQPHAPTYVAWARLEEEEGNKAVNDFYDRNPKSFSAASMKHLLSGRPADPSALDAFDDSDPSIDKQIADSYFPDSLSNRIEKEIPVESGDSSKLGTLENENALIPTANREGIKKNPTIHYNDDYPYFTDPTHSDDNFNFVKNLNPNLNHGLKPSKENMTPEGHRQVEKVVSTHKEETEKEVMSYADSKFQRARQLFALGMRADRRHGILYNAYGHMEMRRGNYSGARHIFELGIVNNCSDLTTVYHAWGLLEVKLNNYDRGAELFRRGIAMGLKGHRELEHDVYYLLHSLGMLFLSRGKYNDAIKVFTTGATLYPHQSKLLLGLALAYVKVGDYDNSRKFFRLAVEADSFHLHAWQCWATAEKQFGNFELARILFRQGLKHGPSHGALWQGFAVMELQQNNIDIARTLLQQAIKRDPQHAQSYQALAYLEAKHGSLVQAKQIAWKGIRRAPNHAALWTIAGIIEENLGDSMAARYILDTGIERFPRHGALFKARGDIEAKQGNYDEARVIYRRGLESDPTYTKTYHAAALMEGRIGNIEGLAELHKDAKKYFKTEGDIMTTINTADNTFSFENKLNILGTFTEWLHDDSNKDIDSYSFINSNRDDHDDFSGIGNIDYAIIELTHRDQIHLNITDNLQNDEKIKN